MKLQALMIVSATMLSATPAVAAVVPAPDPATLSKPPPGWQPPAKSLDEWADRCTDATVNSWAFKHPKNFVKVIELFSDPAIYLEFASRMQDPESYARVVSLMMEPNTAKNYMEWSDPRIYMNWMQASMDPNFYTAAMHPFMDMSTYMRWMMLPADPRLWSVGMNMLNPAMWMKWLAAPVNPRVMEPLAKLADVNTGIRWLQALGDPANFGIWNEWLPNLNETSGGYTPFNSSNPAAWTGASWTPPTVGEPANR